MHYEGLHMFWNKYENNDRTKELIGLTLFGKDFFETHEIWHRDKA